MCIDPSRSKHSHAVTSSHGKSQAVSKTVTGSHGLYIVHRIQAGPRSDEDGGHFVASPQTSEVQGGLIVLQYAHVRMDGRQNNPNKETINRM